MCVCISGQSPMSVLIFQIVWDKALIRHCMMQANRIFSSIHFLSCPKNAGPTYLIVSRFWVSTLRSSTCRVALGPLSHFCRPHLAFHLCPKPFFRIEATHDWRGFAVEDDVTAPWMIPKPSLPQEHLHPASAHPSFKAIWELFSTQFHLLGISLAGYYIWLWSQLTEHSKGHRRRWQCHTHYSKPLIADINAS